MRSTRVLLAPDQRLTGSPSARQNGEVPLNALLRKSDRQGIGKLTPPVRICSVKVGDRDCERSGRHGTDQRQKLQRTAHDAEKDRARHAQTTICAGDIVEVVTLVGGGSQEKAPLKIGSHVFQSRLFVGTGKYATLELMRDCVASSLTIEQDDFEDGLLAQRGGLGKAYQLFGAELQTLVQQMNERLAA